MTRCRYPFRRGVRIKIIQPDGEYAHENFSESYYATDFLVPVGTAVLCAKGGKVFLAKDDSEDFGSCISMVANANLIVVDHQDGTFAEYIHLGKGSARVKVGDIVQTGDLLARTGLSGCMTDPHLHFNFFALVGKEARSLPVCFSPQKNKLILFLLSLFAWIKKQFSGS